MKKFAIGYFNNENFIMQCNKYIDKIKEVYFAWPGMMSCRPPLDFSGDKYERFLEELRWCRANGIALDLIFNCNCYGDDAVSEKLQQRIFNILDEMRQAALFPEIVTTTSPFIATIIRRRYSDISLRASVNMRIHGPIGFEYVKDMFDSFYVNREFQYDLAYMKKCHDWAETNGKELGILVNSGCLRDCPYQQFHDNLHGHNRLHQSDNAKKLNFEIFLCRKCRSSMNESQGTWITPELLHLYEPYVSIIKLSTRQVPHPGTILQAYTTQHYPYHIGNLTDPPFGE